ncbi:quinone oxidoreductase-like protein 1 [Corticium candelabrum]|uniref:quinone oxidoreductase-like protein 1 n=1 Tax=Corticium candelabrum TaxID=121492 RepID=UPI002E264571|nr:quinone oxidoreductase-like protein 1 [Corticium candelabrum]
MRTVRLNVSEDGTQSQLVYTDDAPVLSARAGHVLVDVKACGLSPLNHKALVAMNDSNSDLPVGFEISGIVKEIGPEVTSVQVGDAVTGILPLSSECSGCADECEISEFAVVNKPESVNHITAAGAILPGVWAYTALRYQGHITAGDTVLICDGATANGIIAIQLAQRWGAKVMATAANQVEADFLEKLEPSIAAVINMSKTKSLIETCLAETGGLGVDCVIDQGVEMVSSGERYSELVLSSLSHSGEGEVTKRRPITKHDIISILGFGGRWVTSTGQLQLDPPDSQFLFMKGAAVSFLFDNIWVLSGAQQGKYLHIIQDLMEKLQKEELRPTIHHTLMLPDVTSELERLSPHLIGKVVMRT